MKRNGGGSLRHETHLSKNGTTKEEQQEKMEFLSVGSVCIALRHFAVSLAV